MYACYNMYVSLFEQVVMIVISIMIPLNGLVFQCLLVYEFLFYFFFVFGFGFGLFWEQREPNGDWEGGWGEREHILAIFHFGEMIFTLNRTLISSTSENACTIIIKQINKQTNETKASHTPFDGYYRNVRKIISQCWKNVQP